MIANIAQAHRRQAQLAQRRSAVTASIPAPIRGWNARDPLGEMEPTDAIQLENWWPLAYDVMVRQGHSRPNTGLPGQVESLMVYSSPTGQSLFAASKFGFYDVSTAGAVGAAVVSGLTNARWEYVNVSTAGGNFLLAVNGADKLRGWNGTAWWADGDGTHDITGLDTATITNINVFKERVWLIQGNSLKAWYLPINSIAGAANSLNLQTIARKGGHLVAMGTWTIDAGFGVDDMAVFITSMGEVIVYRGIDPSNAATWSLAGVWQIGAPFSSRCMLKWGGDLLLLTYDGIYPLSEALQSSRLDPRVSITNKIYPAISTATSHFSGNFGWQMEYYAKANMLIINVPTVYGYSQQQYAMNTITKAWTNFTGIDANCWAIYNDEPYFGGNQFVGQFWDTFSDNGGNITANAKSAFNYFGMRGRTKRWTMIRPIISTSGAPSTLVSLNLDFENFDPTGALSFYGINAGLWDIGVWDVSPWGADLNVSKQWQGVNGTGYCAAMRLKVAASGIETHWASTDFVMEGGGTL